MDFRCSSDVRFEQMKTNRSGQEIESNFDGATNLIPFHCLPSFVHHPIASTMPPSHFNPSAQCHISAYSIINYRHRKEMNPDAPLEGKKYFVIAYNKQLILLTHHLLSPFFSTYLPLSFVASLPVHRLPKTFSSSPFSILPLYNLLARHHFHIRVLACDPY